jgi:hypothetical protein
VEHSVYFETVSDNENQYPKRDVTAARAAKQMERRLGYPSKEELTSMVRNGVLTNLPATAADVERAALISGRDVSSIRGKHVAGRPRAKDRLIVGDVFSSVVEMHVDIMFVNGVPFLLGVVKPSDITFIEDMGNSRSAKMVWRGLATMLNVARANEKKVTMVHSDNEGGVKAIEHQLPEGTRLDLSGVGQHVAEAENRIRQVKGRVRTILASLPYPLASFLLFDLLMFITCQLNMVPRSTVAAAISPREAFTGLKPDYQTHCRCEFGEYLEVEVPMDAKSKGTMKPRTTPAIALYPAMNRQGSWYVYELLSDQITKRDHWVHLPMPDSIISHMTELAKSRGYVDSHAIFARGSSIISDEE